MQEEIIKEKLDASISTSLNRVRKFWWCYFLLLGSFFFLFFFYFLFTNLLPIVVVKILPDISHAISFKNL